MNVEATLFICRRENLGSHRMKFSTSTINGAACINRSVESGVMTSSVHVAIPNKNSADAVAAEANGSDTMLGVVSGRRIKER